MAWGRLILALLVVVCSEGFAAAGQCSEPWTAPENTLSNETLCSHVTLGSEAGCDTCVPKGWVCCDNGTGMAFDPFCRYPTDCCATEFCGSQCIKPGGKKCGALVAPAGYECCDDATSGQKGQLCKDPDSCCADHCCSQGFSCCDGNCCEDSQVCCNGLCCAGDTECCGDHCCLKNEDDQCGKGEVCCPSERLCSDNLCCAVGDFCEKGVNKCCDGSWCTKGDKCCHPKTFCNEAGGCCPEDTTFCQYGSSTNCHAYPFDKCCTDGTACTASNPHCTGTGYCCPAAYPYYCAESHECYQRPCSCCGDQGGCCIDPYSCKGEVCQHCYQTGHWWWKKTVCDTMPKSEDEDNGGEKADPNRPTLRLAAQLKGVKPVAASKPVQEKKAAVMPPFVRAPGNARPKAVQPKLDVPEVQQGGSQNGAVLPPAPTLILSPDHYACWENKAQLTDICYLFECLEKMISCGDEGALAQNHLLYCTTFQKYRYLFDSTGKDFLDKATTCIASTFEKVFAQGAFPCCQSIEKWSIGKDQFDCLKSAGFCDVFMTNVAGFDKLFESSTLSAANVYFSTCHINLKDALQEL